MTLPSSKFEDFEQTLRTDVATSVRTVIEAAQSHVLTISQLDTLQATLRKAYPKRFASTPSNVADPGYGADFNLAAEVNDQIRVVRALRSMIIDEGTGAVQEGITAREVKELIGSSNTLLNSLMKFHDRIINQERIRAIEAATIEAVKGLPEAHQTTFFETLEAALSRVQ